MTTGPVPKKVMDLVGQVRLFYRRRLPLYYVCPEASPSAAPRLTLQPTDLCLCMQDIAFLSKKAQRELRYDQTKIAIYNFLRSELDIWTKGRE